MLTMYAVSDSIGETAEQVARAAASQFSDEIIVKRVPYIKAFEDVKEFMGTVEPDSKAMVISTIVQVDVREFLVQMCVEKGIHITNVLGPSISIASRILHKTPEYKPGAIWNMDAQYYKKIEAMEFAIQYDDSRDYSGLKHADVVLLGLSRTSKTPLCMYLANKGIKALNIPLMPEVPLPEELFTIDRRKVIGLTIDPLQLIEIRKRRLDKFSGLTTEIQYANEGRILDELEFSDRIMRKVGCRTIDITKRAIEDTSLIIMEYIGHKK